MRDTLRELGSVVGLFVVVGVGLGLAGYLVVTRLKVSGGAGGGVVGGLVFFQAFSVVYFSAPAVGAVGGVLAGLRSENSVTGAVASAVSGVRAASAAAASRTAW